MLPEDLHQCVPSEHDPGTVVHKRAPDREGTCGETNVLHLAERSGHKVLLALQHVSERDAGSRPMSPIPARPLRPALE